MSITFYIENGDWYMEEDSGKPYMISGINKCRQDMAENYLTEYDKDREIGSELSNLESIPVITAGTVVSLVRKKVSEATDRLINYQKSDPYSTADERIKYIEEIQIVTMPEGSTLFFVKAAVEEGTDTADTVIPISLRHLTDFTIDEIFNVSALLD